MSADPHRSADEAALDALVFEFLERAESAPSRASAFLEELCRRRPELADALRGRVEILARSGLWSTGEREDTPLPERLGEFRIVRQLGRGGMGVVLLAEQTSVDRRVALKLIRGEHLFAGSARARFLREARAIARLDHPSIVQVYTIGEEQGLPFLAMEYVAGAGLDRLLDRLEGRDPSALRGADARDALAAELESAQEPARSSAEAEGFQRGWVEFAVRVTRDTALALQHAHERGVLHRDVKPSNLLVSADGRVRLCDFGLAALGDAATLTRSGAQLGSLPYMAPEQLRGDAAAIGPVSDVYALGVTLYELVTLVRPFPGESEHTVRSAILEARPRSMRAVNPSASVDIETVCSKAMDPDPRRRYASAADFARDLTNVLELRPIEARPPGALVRARRWTQRRPAAAVGVVAGALLALAGPLGWELNRMRTVAEVRQAYDRERVAREQSERDFRAALQAVGHVLRGLASEDLRDAPRMQSVRLSATERAQALFDELERDRSDDPQLLGEGAELYKLRAEVLYDMGRQDEAVASGARALELLERLALADPSADVRERRAMVLGDQAKALQGYGRWAESLEVFERVEGLARELASSSDASPAVRRMVAVTLANVAEARQALGDPQAARRRLEEACAWIDPLYEQAPDDVAVVWAYGRVHGDLGDLSKSIGDHEAARAPMERRLQAFRRARDLAPGRRYYRFDASGAAVSLGSVLAALRESEAAERLLLEARRELDALIDEFPDGVRYVNERWRADQVLGALYGASGRLDEALAIFRDSAERIGREAEQAPERVDLALFAAQAEYNAASGSIHAGAPLEEIEAAFERVERRVDVVQAREPNVALARDIRRMTGYNRALARCLAGRMDAAREAVEAFDGGRSADGADLRFCADLWNELVLALRRSEPDEERRAALESEWTERMFVRLEAAIEAGYDDTLELDATPALESFRSSERFARLRERCAQRAD